jgi:hypothetical protein
LESSAAFWWRRKYFLSSLELFSPHQPYFATAAIDPPKGWRAGAHDRRPEPDLRRRATLGRVIAAHMPFIALILLRNLGLRGLNPAMD